MSDTSPTSNIKSSPSVRRGPTLRGGRFRPAIGRSMRQVSQQQGSIDEEERIGLTNASSDDDDDEKFQFEAVEDVNLTDHQTISEKLETDEHGKPLYHHGNETFGDLITHPVQELHAHQHRQQSFKSRKSRWSALHSPASGRGGRGGVEGGEGGEQQHQQPYSNR